MEDVIIIGGGASGLVAGIFAARNGRKVTILEHKDKIGKKILATGNGKCNYTNLTMNSDCYRSKDTVFFQKVLDTFSVHNTIDFFMELGIYPKIRNGYVYPNSEQAKSVVNVLELEGSRLGVNFLCNIHVEHIHKRRQGFALQTNEGEYQCSKVILATGGCASPNLGSDGSGYTLAREMGHNIIKPLPALVQLQSKGSFYKILAGVRAEAAIKLYVNDRLESSEHGEIQFVKYGLSGIPVLQISRFASHALDIGKKVQVKMDLLPNIDWNSTKELIEKRIANSQWKNMEESLVGLFNNKLGAVLLIEANIPAKMPCKKIYKKQIVELVNKIKGFQVDITSPNPFNQAQVTAGGVDTKEINSRTMESKIMKDLYFCGELIDVDGTCGGYNLQWAWSSGRLAGKSV